MCLIVTTALPSSTSHADPASKSHPQESLPEAPTQNSRQRRNPSSRQPTASRPPIPSARFRPPRPRIQAKMRIVDDIGQFSLGPGLTNYFKQLLGEFFGALKMSGTGPSSPKTPLSLRHVAFIFDGTNCISKVPPVAVFA